MKKIYLAISVAVILLLTNWSAQAQSNMVLFISASGDYIGQGQTYVATSTNNFSFSGSPGGISVSAFGFGFTFTPGSTLGSLGVGSFLNATRWPFNSTGPGIDISGNGRGCDNECGEFQILEFHTNGAGNVDRLWLTYSNTCECSMAPMTGEIRYNSALAPNPGAQVFLVPSTYPTISAAISAAPYSGPTTILVSPGTYNESLTFGGKAAAVVAVAGPSQTILAPPSGQNGVSFTGSETSNSILCGFTITGVVSGDSAVFCDGSSPVIASNIIVNCGNGVYCNYGASPTVVSNVIENCSGNPVYAVIAGTAGFFQGNIIISNANGIFSAYQAAPTFIGNYIMYNNGDAISGFNGSAINIIQNVIAYNNGSAVGYLVPSGDRGPVCVNNTVVGNAAGFSISGFDGSSEIINNVAIGNSALNISYYNSSTIPIIQNNDFYNGGASPYSGVVSNLAGTNGNISADPLFTCNPSSDFRLLPTSPAIDAGSNGAPYLPSTDIIGNARVMGSRIDMGAYEANPAAPVIPCMYISCPGNIMAFAAAGKSNAVVTYPAPTGTPVATIVGVPASGSSFPAGTNVVTCTATYGTNTATCSFTVTVVVPPILTNGPVDMNVSAGQPFSLSVTPQGSAPFIYQWYFQNAAIAGATSDPFTVTNAQAGNEGVYSVGVYNSAGGATSAVMSVRVLPTAPTILSNPASLTVPAASNATFRVVATGSQPLGYQWLFNGKVITNGTNAQYAISGVQSNNSGNYQVLVANSLGTATSAVATLTVTPVLPYFTLQPATVTQLSAGTNLTLTAQANGSQPIGYQWQFNGSNIAGATATALSLVNVGATNSGPYTLVASNFVGPATSAVAQVTVYQKPAIMLGLSNEVANVGSTVVLSVTALGTQPLAYSWQLNSQPIAGTNATLTITNIQPRQSGFYQLTATNQYGSASSSARISVLGLPGTLTIWGDNSGGQATVPTNLGVVVAVAGGDYDSIALQTNGTIAAWGYDGDGETAVPTNALQFVAIASGAEHNLAITQSGSVEAWGENASGQCNVPGSVTNNAVAVAAGDAHSLVLLSSGTVVGWGDNSFGQISIPQGLAGVQAIAAGREHSLALRTNGTVTAWGYNAYGQASVPSNLTNAVAIAAGYLHSAALLANGTVMVWGDNSYGQCNVPANATNVVAIAAGDFHTLALLGNGTVVGWGSDGLGQLNVPAGLSSVTTIASGNYDSLALVPGPGMVFVTKGGSQMVLRWSGPGILQSAPSITGPFTDMAGVQGTSYTNSNLNAPAMFFRVRW